MAYINNKEANLYIPYFTKFAIPYYDDEGRAFAFKEETPALAWNNKKNNKEISIREKTFSKDEFYTLCYKTGAKSILLDFNEKKEEILLNERMEEIHSGYYNSRLNRNIVKLLETKHSIYLKDIVNCKFLVAAYIQKKPFNIMYAAAKSPESAADYYYLAFSTLEEFDKWKTDNKWRPVEVDFKALTSFSHKHPFIINPRGMKLVLSSEQINKIGGRT